MIKDPSASTTKEANKQILPLAMPFPKQAGYFDFSMTGKILLQGEKRIELLQGLTTNNLNNLLPGQSIQAFILDKFGKIQSPLTILQFKKDPLLLLPFLQTDKISGQLTTAAKLLDCEIQNMTFEFALLSVMGKNANELLEKTFGEIEPHSFTLHSLHSIVFQHKGGVDKAKEQSTIPSFNDTKKTPLPGFTKIKGEVDFAIIKSQRTTIQNYDLLIPKDGLEKVMTKLKQTSITKQNPELFELQRIKDGFLQWSTDYNESNNPIELSEYANKFLSETKGCYLGQEIIARLKHRADSKTAKKIVQLTAKNQLSKSSTIKVDDLIFYNYQGETKQIGKITSAAHGNGTQITVAIAYLKKPYYDELVSKEVLVGDARIRATVQISS